MGKRQFKASPSPWISAKSFDFANYEHEVYVAPSLSPLPSVSAPGSPQLSPPPDSNPPKDNRILLVVRALAISAGVVGLCEIIYCFFFSSPPRLSLFLMIRTLYSVRQRPGFPVLSHAAVLVLWMCIFFIEVNIYFNTTFLFLLRIAPFFFYKRAEYINFSNATHIISANLEIFVYSWIRRYILYSWEISCPLYCGNFLSSKHAI